MAQANARALVQQAIRRLTEVGVESPALDARLLMQHALQMSAEQWIAMQGEHLSAQQEAAFEQLILRREKREPVSHIVGVREFWGREFLVTADVLDPRPDSETLVQAVLDATVQRSEKKRVLDLGTGSGCLLLSLLSEWPDSAGIGVDTSPAALKIARMNAQRLALDERANFVQSDWCAGVTGTYDVIVSNPPYVSESEYAALAPEVRDYEPRQALVAQEQGLQCYRQILSQIREVMNPGALLAFEIGVSQAEQVAALTELYGLELVAIRPDLTGRPRCVLARQP